MGYYLASTGAVHYFMENALGSSTGVIDETLARINWYLYDGYGVTDIVRQGEYTPYKFAGKHGYFSDGDSGMILLGHRYYMPDLGKFLTQDPLGHEAGLNLYQYAHQNPLVNIDPDGTEIKILVGTHQWEYSRHDAQLVWNAIHKLENTKTLGPWLRRLEATKDEQVWIGNSPYKHNAFGGLSGDVHEPDIKINLRVNARVKTTKGWQRSSFEVVLAHELGHYGTQSLSPGFFPSHSIPIDPTSAQEIEVSRYIENGVRRELHYPLRTRYYRDNDVYRPR